MTKPNENFFLDLVTKDVSKYVEKKGRFSYLSWTYAVEQLKTYDHEATWEVVRFDGLPFLKTECGYFVEVAVTVKGVTISQIHPVLNHQNKPIAEPNAFEINTSIQRCLVKAIAIATGLGLYIYSGEDLPPEAPPETITPEQFGELKTLALKFGELRNSDLSGVLSVLNNKKSLTLENIQQITTVEAAAYIVKLKNWIKKAEEKK